MSEMDLEGAPWMQKRCVIKMSMWRNDVRVGVTKCCSFTLENCQAREVGNRGLTNTRQWEPLPAKPVW
jgi:hypothetical protein